MRTDALVIYRTWEFPSLRWPQHLVCGAACLPKGSWPSEANLSRADTHPSGFKMLLSVYAIWTSAYDHIRAARALGAAVGGTHGRWRADFPGDLAQRHLGFRVCGRRSRGGPPGRVPTGGLPGRRLPPDNGTLELGPAWIRRADLLSGEAGRRWILR